MKRLGTIPLDQVPPPPTGPGETQHNGDVVYVSGLDRWRLNAAGEIVYFIRYESEREDRATVYERPRRRG